MNNRTPRNVLTVLVNDTEHVRSAEDKLDPERMQGMVAEWVREQVTLRREVLERLQQHREKRRNMGSKGKMQSFEAGEYVDTAGV